MHGLCCPDREAADLNGVAGLDLADVLVTLSPHERAAALGDDEARAARHLAERGKVEVVVVEVRDEHRVDATDRTGVGRPSAAQMQHPVAQHGIGQEPSAVEVDDERPVPEPGDRPVLGLGGHCAIVAREAPLLDVR